MLDAGAEALADAAQQVTHGIRRLGVLDARVTRHEQLEAAAN